MNTKTTIPISEARRIIFEIAEKVQKPNRYYTLTERGRPKAVLLSARWFERLMDRQASYAANLFAFGGELLRDGSTEGYGDRALFARKKLVPPDEAGLSVKAVLLVELMEEYGYPLTALEFGNFVPIEGQGGKRYVEADVLAYDRTGKVTMVIETVPFEEYDARRDEIVEDLFDIARAVSKEGRPRHLVYFSREIGADGRERKKALVIDAEKYETFVRWQKAGCPAGANIPSYGDALSRV